MRQGQGSKRSRGRGGGRRNTPQRHQSFDSNGPSIRIRGNAHQVYEKYLQLARDANASGDRVTAENMFQHAEHYFRILNVEEKESQIRAQNRSNGEDGDGAQPRQSNRGNGADPRARNQRQEESPQVETTESQAPEISAGDETDGATQDAATPVNGAGREEEAPVRRPQRRVRRGNGQSSPERDSATAEEVSSQPAAAEVVSEARSSEPQPEDADATLEKGPAD